MMQLPEQGLKTHSKRVELEYKRWHETRELEEWGELSEDAIFTVVQMAKSANELSKACAQILGDAAEKYREEVMP